MTTLAAQTIADLIRKFNILPYSQIKIVRAGAAWGTNKVFVEVTNADGSTEFIGPFDSIEST